MAYIFILSIHIGSGALALITGALSAAKRKGGENHKRWGRIFALTMIISALAGLVLSIIKHNNFLLAIAAFTLYLVASGWIWGRNYTPRKKKRMVRMVGLFGLLTASTMIILAFTGNQLNHVLLCFGSLLMAFAIPDLLLKRIPGQMASRHGGRMGGAYIAALTAFLVVSINFLPALLIWFGPTVVGSVLITLSIRNYLRKSS